MQTLVKFLELSSVNPVVKLFQALESSMNLHLTSQRVFEGVFTGEFLLSKGKQVEKEKEYLCLIDMNKRVIQVLGVYVPRSQPPLVE